MAKTLVPIDSEALRALGYDHARKTLLVQFASGAVYEYFSVDEDLYGRMLAAQPHPWSEYGDEVLQHSYRRIR